MLIIYNIAGMLQGFQPSIRGFHAQIFLWKLEALAMDLTDTVSFLLLLENLKQLVQSRHIEQLEEISKKESG